MTPVARNTDPQTSHDAADSVVDPSNKQYAVWLCLGHCGPCLDEELIADYTEAVRRQALPAQSESGIRSRRHELVELGWAKAVGKRRNSRGRLATIWQAVGR
jgi:hypothetical protein